MRIAILNGPNLNLLGTREPEIYGSTTLAEIEARARVVAKELGVELAFAQFNHEGDLIDAIHALGGVATGGPAAGVAPELREKADGIVVNAGAWTHTSIALADAFSSVKVPYVEVHLSNIFAREPERRHSVLAAGARGFLCGFGALGYEMAQRGLVNTLRSAKR